MDHLKIIMLSKAFKLFLFLFISASYVFAEENFTVSGFVKDEASGEILIGSTVFVKEIGTGAQTNVYGFYSLTLPAGKYTLEYRYIGYATKSIEIKMTASRQLNIELVSDEVELKEIVINGVPEDQKCYQH